MIALALLLQTQSVPAARIQQLLERVVEEAEMLRQGAPKSIAEETLEQRALRTPSRFKPRVGTAAQESARFQAREIVSEYSVGSLKETGSDDLTEFRQVVSVDGRPIQTRASARQSLAFGLLSREDRMRKAMLESFERHGLVGAVTDFGILLLQFTKRGIRELQLAPTSIESIGADQALVFQYKQVSGGAGLLNFSRKAATRYPLEGQLFVRLSDGLPLRVTCIFRRIVDKRQYVDTGTVDYVMTSHGFVAPTSVTHRGFVDGQLVVENLFRYASFKTFQADTEIKFTEVPEPPSTPGKP